MCSIICVTSRASCTEDFLERIRKIAAAHPLYIILREKDLPDTGYLALYRRCEEICTAYNVPVIFHSHVQAALAAGVRSIHLPLPVLRTLQPGEIQRFELLGVSVHSAAEAVEAQKLGAGYLIAGHIFETDCKRGLAGRGTAYLQDVACAVCIPVYGIGGITPENFPQILRTGAAGACVMSGLMRCAEPAAYLDEFRRCITP